MSDQYSSKSPDAADRLLVDDDDDDVQGDFNGSIRSPLDQIGTNGVSREDFPLGQINEDEEKSIRGSIESLKNAESNNVSIGGSNLSFTVESKVVSSQPSVEGAEGLQASSNIGNYSGPTRVNSRDPLHRKRSQTENPNNKFAAIGPHARGLPSRFTGKEYGFPGGASPAAKDIPNPFAEVHKTSQVNNLQTFSLRESVNDEDVIAFRRKVEPQGRISKFFKFGKQYSELQGGPEEVSNPEKMEEEVKAESLGRRAVYDNFSTIDWMFDQNKERVRWNKMKRLKGWRGRLLRAYDNSQSWLVVISVGLVVGVLTTCISISTEWLSTVKLGYCKDSFYLNNKFCCYGESESCSAWVSWDSIVGSYGSYTLYTVFCCLFGTSAAFIVKQLAPYAAGGGIPECKTIMSGFVIKDFLAFKTLLVKSATLALAVASGLTLGKEGPLVHIACCVGNLLPKLFSKYRSNEARKREVLSAATAAGVSVAFGAPIGGVLFSLEEVSYYFPHKTMFRTFFGSMVAVSILQIMNPLRTGRLVMYSISFTGDWKYFEVLPFILIGVFGGLFGALFIHLNIKMVAFRRTSALKNHPIVEIFGLCLLTALTSYQNVFMKIDNSALIANLFGQCTEVEDGFNLCDQTMYGKFALFLIWAITMKTLLFIITFGAKVPCGNFVPSMAIGSCFGRLVGLTMEVFQRNYPDFGLFSACHPDAPCINQGTYAMLGAAAFLGGVTRMTVSLTVIMFEITGALTYILPIMITLMVAKFIGDIFGKEGIAEAYIELNRYPFVDHKEEYHHNIPCTKVMTDKAHLVYFPAAELTILEMEQILEKYTYKGFPIVMSSTDHTLVGYIARSEIKCALKEAKTLYKARSDTQIRFIRADIPNSTNFVDFKPWMDQTPINLTHKFPMATVVDIFRKMGLRYAIITKNGKLYGLITKKDVLRHLAFMHRFEVKDEMADSETVATKDQKGAGNLELRKLENGRAVF